MFTFKTLILLATIYRVRYRKQDEFSKDHGNSGAELNCEPRSTNKPLNL